MANKVDDFVEVGGGEVWDGSKPVQGFYVHKAENVGPNNSMMYTLRTKDGDISIWGSAVLDSKFDQIRIGDEVRVEFTGLSDKSGKFGKPFKTYKVSVRPGPADGYQTQEERDPGITDIADDEDTDDIDLDKLPY